MRNRLRSSRGWPALATTLLLAIACGEAAGPDRASGPAGPDPVPPPADLAGSWARSTPAAEGFDLSALERAVEAAALFGNLRSLVIARNGRLVRDLYFGGTHADSAHDMRSVTKSVTALLVGIASDRGLLDIDQSMTEWLEHESLRPEHDAISIRHLLTMTSGMQWSDQTDFNPWVLSGRPVGYVLDQEVVAPPGQLFRYNTGGSHLLAAIVDRASPDGAVAFAEDHLFGPLGIVERRWPVMEDGVPAGGVALALRPTDAAKLGQLILQRGRSGARQIVSRSWIDAQIRDHVRLGAGGDGVLADGGYGYQTWWDDGGGGPGVRAALMWGYGGQFVWVVPDRQLVVVTTNHWHGVADYQFQQAGYVAREIVRPVVAAARPISR